MMMMVMRILSMVFVGDKGNNDGDNMAVLGRRGEQQTTLLVDSRARLKDI